MALPGRDRTIGLERLRCCLTPDEAAAMRFKRAYSRYSMYEGAFVVLTSLLFKVTKAAGPLVGSSTPSIRLRGDAVELCATDGSSAACWMSLEEALEHTVADFRRADPAGMLFDKSYGCEGLGTVVKMLESAGSYRVLSGYDAFDEALELSDGWTEERREALLRNVTLASLKLDEQRLTDRKAGERLTFLLLDPKHMQLFLRAFGHTPWLYVFSAKGEAKHRLTAASVDASGVLRSTEELSTVKELSITVTAPGVSHNAALHALITHPETGLAAECRHDLPRAFYDLLLPGHFKVAVGDEEARLMTTVMTSSVENEQHETDAAVKEVVASLRGLSHRNMAVLNHTAWLKRQEGYVYNRTKSRFVDAPVCPDVPQRPKLYKVMDMIQHWHPDDITPPSRHHSTICRFDYNKEWEKAKAYRAAEVPFVMYNVPYLKQAREKWTPEYLSKKFGKIMNHVEISPNSHFQYYNADLARKEAVNGYTPPSLGRGMPWEVWHDWAVANMHNITKDDTYLYMESTEMPFFKKDLRVLTPQVDLFEFPDDQQEINCRFAMHGTFVDTHFDSMRNMIAQIAGTRRWILGPPEECRNAYLLPEGHPSRRHSRFDWARPVDLEKYPRFAEALGTEVILTEGDVLYLPAYWLHTISTLLPGPTYQCNAFGGHSSVGMDSALECGFYSEELLVEMWREEMKKEVYKRAKRRKLNKKAVRQLRVEAKGRMTH